MVTVDVLVQFQRRKSVFELSLRSTVYIQCLSGSYGLGVFGRTCYEVVCGETGKNLGRQNIVFLALVTGSCQAYFRCFVQTLDRESVSGKFTHKRKCLWQVHTQMKVSLASSHTNESVSGKFTHKCFTIFPYFDKLSFLIPPLLPSSPNS